MNASKDIVDALIVWLGPAWKVESTNRQTSKVTHDNGLFFELTHKELMGYDEPACASIAEAANEAADAGKKGHCTVTVTKAAGKWNTHLEQPLLDEWKSEVIR